MTILATSRVTHLFPTHPGEIIKAEMEERGYTGKRMAEESGLQASHISEVINCKRPVNRTIAEAVSNVFGWNPQTLLYLQSDYDYDVKVIAERNKMKKRRSRKTKPLVEGYETSSVAAGEAVRAGGRGIGEACSRAVEGAVEAERSRIKHNLRTLGVAEDIISKALAPDPDTEK